MIHRIIARLDIKGPNLVKGIELEGLRVLGKPEKFAKKYYEDGADELIYQDVVASLYDRSSLLDIVEKTAEEIFIPLTVGGGLRSLSDMQNVLRAGADKISINTAALKNPKLVTKAANTFGSSAVVVSIDCKLQPNGSYEAYIDNGREKTGKKVLDWAKTVEKLGAGEILLTSIDKDGTLNGYDLNLVSLISKSVSIPVIASGGARNEQDIESVLSTGCHAAATASLLHYKISSIPKVKKYLLKRGFKLRP